MHDIACLMTRVARRDAGVKSEVNALRAELRMLEMRQQYGWYGPDGLPRAFGYTPQECECRWVDVETPAYYVPRASCGCPADPSLYRPAPLKPGTRPWTLQQASAHCANPNLCVILPAPGSKISGNVHIVGSANAENFQGYKVEWWGKGGSGWSFLLEKNTPVVNGELLMLNTSTVPAGKYGLRLTVIDQSGNYGEPFEIWWTVTR